ncbi:unnamed protein product [Schistocephalus solidus]|uniref:ORF3 n=1 Tax=Schistocephalus solidus TaxID=70667 RepID=A0A183SLM9_SCHSO|nr:unnamed protein product [Schistocephalus solidus]
MGIADVLTEFFQAGIKTGLLLLLLLLILLLIFLRVLRVLLLLLLLQSSRSSGVARGPLLASYSFKRRRTQPKFHEQL